MKKIAKEPIEKNAALPRSLWKFYIKYAARGHWALLIAWALLLIYLRLGMGYIR